MDKENTFSELFKTLKSTLTGRVRFSDTFRPCDVKFPK